MDEQTHTDEEQWYAMLDTAFSEDSLSVSEELIQKTLQRVKQEENRSRAGRKGFAGLQLLSYGTMAAAAVLCVLLLGNGIRNIRMQDGAAETRMLEEKGIRTTVDFTETVELANAETAGAKEMELDVPGESDMASLDPAAQNDAAAVCFTAEYADTGEYRELSEEVCSGFRQAGYELLTKQAVVWKRTGAAGEAPEAIDWNRELAGYWEQHSTGTLEVRTSSGLLFSDETHLHVVSDPEAAELLMVETVRGRIWICSGPDISMLE